MRIKTNNGLFELRGDVIIELIEIHTMTKVYNLIMEDIVLSSSINRELLKSKLDIIEQGIINKSDVVDISDDNLKKLEKHSDEEFNNGKTKNIRELKDSTEERKT